jgi:hypothetical protein
MSDVNEMGNSETSYFIPDEPEEQVKERRAEKAKVLAARELILEMIERMTKRVEFYDSINSVPAARRKDDYTFRFTLDSNANTKANLEAELTYLTDLKDQYL